MKTICVIPARFNSSRFPGKLLVSVRGKTILQRTFERAAGCKAIDGLFVATDDEKIAEHIKGFGGEVIWTSPSCINGTERIVEALKVRPELQKAEIVVNVQGDHPMTSPEAIGMAVHLLKRDPKAQMSTLATPLVDLEDFQSPHVVKCVFDQDGNALYFSRSPIPYSAKGVPKGAYHHVGLYAYRTSFLLSSLDYPTTPLQGQEDLEQLKVLERGYRIKVGVISEVPIGVDTPGDLVKLEKCLHLINKDSF